MMATRGLALLTLLITVSSKPIQPRAPDGNKWNIIKTTQGNDFYNHFDFVTFDDPTHGRTNYVDANTARSKGLSWVNGDQFGMTCDTSGSTKDHPRGRDSIRIQSHDTYDEVLMVFDVQHMPDGCGTWPAIWTNAEGSTWPTGGEFDIIEGTNGRDFNRVTLHSGPDDKCVLEKNDQPGMSPVSGDLRPGSCVGGAGCTIEDKTDNSWATGFNNNRGGWYVYRKNSGGFAVWFFPRDSTTVPASIKNGEGVIDEGDLGIKVADFPFWGGHGGCDYKKAFTKQTLIINLAMGGDWAASRYKGQGCPGEIYDLIDNKPEALKEAYWLINGIRIYNQAPGYGATPNGFDTGSSPAQTGSSASPTA